MLPIILLGAAAYGLWQHQKISKKPGKMTPERAKIHGQLMGREFNPVKLDKAAALFRGEGLAPQARDLSGKAAQIRKQAQVAAELVKRARCNDQNALGMIAAIREEAARNSPRALVSANLIAKYCQKFPAPQLGPNGETPMLPEG